MIRANPRMAQPAAHRSLYSLGPFLVLLVLGSVLPMPRHFEREPTASATSTLATHSVPHYLLTRNSRRILGKPNPTGLRPEALHRWCLL